MARTKNHGYFRAPPFRPRLLQHRQAGVEAAGVVVAGVAGRRLRRALRPARFQPVRLLQRARDAELEAEQVQHPALGLPEAGAAEPQVEVVVVVAAVLLPRHHHPHHLCRLWISD
jgi:hypothetical protein